MCFVVIVLVKSVDFFSLLPLSKGRLAVTPRVPNLVLCQTPPDRVQNTCLQLTR